MAGESEQWAVLANGLGSWKTSLICVGLPVVAKFEKLVVLLPWKSNENPELGKRHRDIQNALPPLDVMEHTR
jgi:hypothetical protein